MPKTKGLEGEIVADLFPEDEELEEEDKIFAVKTAIGHEKAAATSLYNRIGTIKNKDVYSILSPQNLRGYLLIEARSRERLKLLLKGVPHVRTVVEGTAEMSEVEGFLTPQPAVKGVAPGDIVELIAGPFKGEKARVQHIEESREEITVELFESMVPIPITVRGDHIRVLEKEDYNV